MSPTNSLLGTLMPLPTLNYNFMDTLDKYRIIIDRIQEMCTSTVALAPYPIGPVGSVTTVHYKSNKGVKESKMPKPRKAIVETMLELAELCEGYYLYGQPVSGDTFRAFMEKKKQGAEALKKQLEEESKSPLAKAKDKILHVYTKIKAKVPYNKEKSKAVIGQAIDTMKKPQEQLNCSYVSEGRHLKQINYNVYRKMKNMKYIDPDYYNLPSNKLKKVLKTMGHQQKYMDLVAGAEKEKDQAKFNIIGGQIKRTQNRLRNLTREERARIHKSMGKYIQSQITRDPTKMRKRQKRLEKLARRKK